MTTGFLTSVGKFLANQVQQKALYTATRACQLNREYQITTLRFILAYKSHHVMLILHLACT